MKDKDSHTHSLPTLHKIPQKRQRLIKAFLITCFISYLLWTYNPGRLRSWHHLRLSEFETWLQEVADLMKELYELLQEMRYLKPNSIAYPPHPSPGINLTLAADVIGMSAEAITLLSILPYVVKSPDPVSSNRLRPIMRATQWRGFRYSNEEMLLSTAFADMRVDGELRRSRDPFFGWHEEPLDSYFEDSSMHFLQSWMVGLSGRNQISSRSAADLFPSGGVLVLDLKTRNIYTVGDGASEGAAHGQHFSDGYDDSSSIDPVTKGQLAPGVNIVNMRDRARIEMFASRPATEVLRDYIERFRRLEWVPGFLEGDSFVAWPRDVYRALYLEHGWPSNFNGDAFEKARTAWYQEKAANQRTCWPIRNLDSLELSHARDQEFVEGWKADLIEIDKIEANATAPPTGLLGWDPKRKMYKSRTKEETLDAIEFVNKRIVEDEVKLVELRKKVDEIDEKLKKERAEVISKYGSYWDLQYTWE